jgi:hypothetical protein
MSSQMAHTATPVKEEWRVFIIWLLHPAITMNTFTSHYTNQPSAARWQGNPGTNTPTKG